MVESFILTNSMTLDLQINEEEGQFLKKNEEECENLTYENYNGFQEGFLK